MTSCSVKTSRPREAAAWGELQQFVAELLEEHGAVVEPVEPEGLDVLAPPSVQRDA